jgi:hypothetical protein
MWVYGDYMNAHVTNHVYRDGYRRPGHDRPFHMVRCDSCLWVLNSGHHYSPEHVTNAQRLADEHNTERHGV